MKPKCLKCGCLVSSEWVLEFGERCNACHRDWLLFKKYGPAPKNPDMPEKAPVGRKDDRLKDPWHLVPTRPLRAVVRVLAHGAAKYGAQNWRSVPDGRARYYAAALRHLMAWWEGELLDPESGHPHLGHAIASLVFLMELEGK